MLTLILVRHGHSECNIEGLIQGQLDAPLSGLGIRQARAVAERLAREPLAAVYSSDLKRALATAEAVAHPHGLPVQATPLIRECGLGVAEGMTAEQFRQAYPEEERLWRQDPFTNRPPGAERFQDVIERCGRFLQMVRARHPDGSTIAAAVHVGSVSGLICAALDLPARAYTGFFIANASISVLELGETNRLVRLNDVAHLDGLTSP
ncbi:MAG: histidine phosphatase family protein [Armatimonadota bacterium]